MIQKTDLRAGTRLTVNQRGSLNAGDAEDTWFPCLIVDMSDNGILLMSNREFPVGQILTFKAELFPEKFLACKVEVVHVDDTRLGTKIIEIDKSGFKLCQAYLEEQYAVRLAKLGPR
jgi:hypothetical protein